MTSRYKCKECTAIVCNECYERAIDKTNKCVVCRQDFKIKQEQTMKREIYDIELKCSWKNICYFPCCCCFGFLWCFFNV